HIMISVIDTGYGMEEKDLDSIYDPFVSSKTRGAGLGLTMVYQIIMNHHGEINITSQINKGTMVTIQLPISMGH
ncbi:MAG: ATP-binding protein, partial [Thermodesulfobacteriota bacterium]|nr:ATP-binding protein [Thermodesulfobacteriota bacterium]